MQLDTGRHRARAKYRDYDGVTRVVERFGKTGAAAERALVEALRDRSNAGRGDVITGDTTIADLAAAWLVTVETADKLAEQSLYQYRRAVASRILPALGAVRIREAGVGLLDRFLRGIDSPSTAKRCRVVLTAMFGLAARHGAVDHNPMRETVARETKQKVVRALTIDEIAALRIVVAGWAGGNATGPPRALDLPELFDTLLGTGARIGEVLALRIEEDVDLVSDPPTVTIAGTIVGNKRQPFPKTSSSHSVKIIPRFTAAAIARQIARDFPTDELGLLFPSRAGGPRTVNNVERQWRSARGEVFEWVTLHVFRKTVATAVERSADIETASAQLGHAGTEVTRRHYIQRAAVGPDVRHVLEALHPPFTHPKLARQAGLGE